MASDDEVTTATTSPLDQLSPEATRLLEERVRFWPTNDGGLRIGWTYEADEEEAARELARWLADVCDHDFVELPPVAEPDPLPSGGMALAELRSYLERDHQTR